MAQGQNTSSILDFVGQAFSAYAAQSVKPGFKKSEFWLTLAGAAAGMVPAFGGPYGPIISGLLVLGYTALRTFVTAKAGTTAAAISGAVPESTSTTSTTTKTASFPPGRM